MLFRRMAPPMPVREKTGCAPISTATVAAPLIIFRCPTHPGSSQAPKGSPSRSGSLSHLYRAIVGSMSVSPTSSAPFANSLHVLTAHVARSASVLATCCYASLSLLKPVAVSICPRVANWRGCGSCCLVCGCEPIQCNR